jgi:hypothetical protein
LIVGVVKTIGSFYQGFVYYTNLWFYRKRKFTNCTILKLCTYYKQNNVC